ncbi:MAG: hypothetical protein WDN25_13770 [Acetobacteraceae bacterium]
MTTVPFPCQHRPAIVERHEPDALIISTYRLDHHVALVSEHIDRQSRIIGAIGRPDKGNPAMTIMTSAGLVRAGAPRPLDGKVAIMTGSTSGIDQWDRPRYRVCPGGIRCDDRDQ